MPKKTAKKPGPKKGSKRAAKIKLPPTLTPEQLAIKAGDYLYRVAREDGDAHLEGRLITQAGRVALVLAHPFSGMKGGPIRRAEVGGAIATSRIAALAHALACAQDALTQAEEAYDKAETHVARLEALQVNLLSEALAESSANAVMSEPEPAPAPPAHNGLNQGEPPPTSNGAWLSDHAAAD